MNAPAITFSRAELEAAMQEWARRQDEESWPSGERETYAANCAAYLAKLLAEHAEARADFSVSPAVTATFANLVDAFTHWRAEWEASGQAEEIGEQYAKLAADYLWSILEGIRSRTQAVQA